MSPRRKNEPFSSFRILSKKAQHLLVRARDRIRQDENGNRREAKPPVVKEREGIMVSISVGSVAKATLTILTIIGCAWLLFHLRDKILLLVLAVFVAIVMDPTVRFLERWRVPRILAVLLVYLAFLSLAVFLLASLIPIVAEQLQGITRLIAESSSRFLENPSINIPFLTTAMNAQLTGIVATALAEMQISDSQSILQEFLNQFSSAATNSFAYIVRLAGGIANFFVSFILVLVLAFFVQMEREKMTEHLRLLFPRSYRSYFDSKTEAIHHKMAQWINGQITLCFVIGILVFVALSVIGMQEYAITLALLAGFTEFIPVVGPVIAAVPAILIAGTEGGAVQALVVAGVYYIIQWSENNLLVPLIMRRAVGLSPIAILFAMMVGVSFPDTIHPILGIILSVPVTTILTLFLRDYQEMHRKS